MAEINGLRADLGGTAAEHDLAPRVSRDSPSVALEEAGWLRLAMASSVAATQVRPFAWRLGPGSVTAFLAHDVPLPAPFRAGPAPCGSGEFGLRSFELPRDECTWISAAEAAEVTAASRNAAVVTLSGSVERTLVDLMAMSSVAIDGPPVALGNALGDLIDELASQRWCDLDEVVVVGADKSNLNSLLERLEHVRLAPTIADARALVAQELSGLGDQRTRCFVVLPERPLTGERRLLPSLVELVDHTEGCCVVCCDLSARTKGVWELVSDRRTGYLEVRGRRGALALLRPPEPEPVLAPRLPPSSTDTRGTMPGCPAGTIPVARHPWAKRHLEHLKPPSGLEVKVMGAVAVCGKGVSLQTKPRLLSLVVYLALHPDGETNDAIETAVWQGRRIKAQTLSNRLHEARRALGKAPDGSARIRRLDGRLVLSDDVECDWHRFQQLTSAETDPQSWRDALDLVRGPAFKDLPFGDWTSEEGFASRIQGAVVNVATDYADYCIGMGDIRLAEWALRKGALMDPCNELVARLRMVAADKAGNREGVKLALVELALALGLVGDPLEGVHPITAAMYRQLMGRGAGTVRLGPSPKGPTATSLGL